LDFERLFFHFGKLNFRNILASNLYTSPTGLETNSKTIKNLASVFFTQNI